MASNDPFDNTGNPYNITRVMTAEHHTFNITAYDEYSPLYLPATYIITYLLAFALSTCVIVHTILYHGRTVLDGIMRVRVEEDDIHAKLMRNYPEGNPNAMSVPFTILFLSTVPDWWYATCLAFFFSVAVLAVKVKWAMTLKVSKYLDV
jgi:OPT oligopeptide transporter protein